MGAWVANGSFNREHRLYEELLETGYIKKIYWFTYGTQDLQFVNLVDARIRIVPMPKLFGMRIGSFFYSILIPLIQRSKIAKCDILKTNQFWGSWAACLSGWVWKKPVWIRTGYTFSLFYKKTGSYIGWRVRTSLEKWMFRCADAVSVSSRGDAKYIKTFAPDVSVDEIPNFVDTDLFSPSTSIAPDRDIIVVGRLESQKNLEALLYGLEGSARTLTIVGQGALRPKLLMLAQQLHVDAEFLGRISNASLPDQFRRHRIYVLCSLYEGMPKTLLEAMACGMPCVGTNVPGINEVIQDGNNGILCGTSPQEIRAAIDRLMGDTELRRSMGVSAREHIERYDSLREVVRLEIELYKKLLTNADAPRYDAR